jgi:hypothetical protein
MWNSKRCCESVYSKTTSDDSGEDHNLEDVRVADEEFAEFENGLQLRTSLIAVFSGNTSQQRYVASDLLFGR